MAIVVGNVVRGENFWDRKDEIQNIWDAIETNSHILISAPRRVGKTSIMYKILDEPKANYIPLYIDTESADSQNEFWQKLFHALHDEEFTNKLESFAKTFLTKIKNIKIDKVTTSGVEFGDGKVLDYKEAFKRLVKDLDSDKKIVIMIDEFAQTIENIIKYEDEKSALNLLKTHRELRQDSKISNKVIFVYAGSIGLESVVVKMGATKHINDLNSIKVSPLNKDEAIEFINKICNENDIKIANAEILYILEKIEWLIPFYIQLVLQEIKKLYRKSPNVTTELVDISIDNVLDHRNHFENWLSKLKEAFKKDTYLFAKEVLNEISQKQTFKYNEIINLSNKYKLDEDIAKEIIHSLIYDGYINNNEDNKIYRFNSPILRMWWYKNVVN